MRDLFETFVARHLQNYRPDWDNLSDDVCYISPDEAILSRTHKLFKSRQKPHADLSIIERSAHESPAACARVCEYDGLDVDKILTNNDGTTPSADDMQTALRARQREREDDGAFKLARKCFQWRYHDGVCCTSKSFKLGTPRHSGQDDGGWHSGWYMKGIEDWIATRGECKEVAWRQLFGV